MRDRILTEDEVSRFLEEKKTLPSRCSMATLWKILGERGDFPLFKELSDADSDSQRELIKIHSDKVNAYMRAMLVGGEVSNNPLDRICPECGSKYMAEILHEHAVKRSPEEIDMKKTEPGSEPLFIGGSDVMTKKSLKWICLCCGYGELL